jgi:hypothetical protein
MKTNLYSKHEVRSARLVALCAALTLTLGLPAFGQQDSDGEMSAEEIAEEMANPNAVLGTLGFPIDYIRYDGTLPGASDESGYTLSFQPSLPKPLKSGANLFIRPLIPIFLDRPLPTEDGFDSKAGLGDIGFDAALGKNFDSGWLAIVGIVGSLPTATEDELGRNQVRLGPEVLVGYLPKWGVMGMLVTHTWRVSGDSDVSTSVTGGQYFLTVKLKNAWELAAQPTFSYNHNAAEDNKLAFPLGIGLRKTIIAGKTPWRFGVQYWYYVESPEQFGPKHQLRATVDIVIPLPW